MKVISEAEQVIIFWNQITKIIIFSIWKIMHQWMMHNKNKGVHCILIHRASAHCILCFFSPSIIWNSSHTTATSDIYASSTGFFGEKQPNPQLHVAVTAHGRQEFDGE